MASETTSKTVDGKKNLRHYSRYSWGGNSDHSEFWVACDLCKHIILHSEDGDWDGIDEDMDYHERGVCIQPLHTCLEIKELSNEPF